MTRSDTRGRRRGRRSDRARSTDPRRTRVPPAARGTAPPEASPALELVIERLAGDGAGIARAPDGRIAFVPLTAPGDRVRVRPTTSKRSFLRAELLEVLAPGPARVEAVCPAFGHCGGCAWQHVDYADQLRAKAAILHDALTRIGRLAQVPSIQVVPSPQPYGYRGRARLRVEAGRPGYRQASSEQIIPVSDCPVLAAPLRTALAELAARRPDDGEWELALGEAEPDRPDGVRTSKLTGKPDGTATPGNDLRLRAGEETIRIAPGGFAQANVLLFDALIAAVVGAALGRAALRGAASRGAAFRGAALGEASPGRVSPGGVSHGKAVRIDAARIHAEPAEAGESDVSATGAAGQQLLELFAGSGFFTLPLARRFARVLAVESDATAIANLRRAAADAELDNIEAVVDDVGEFVDGHRFRSFRADVVFADPPRAGLGAQAVAALSRPGPTRLVYLSCDPATLARDLATLTRSGWSLASVRGFDLFPQTPHVEALAVLTRPGRADRSRVPDRAAGRGA